MLYLFSNKPIGIIITVLLIISLRPQRLTNFPKLIKYQRANTSDMLLQSHAISLFHTPYGPANRYVPYKYIYFIYSDYQTGNK